MIGFSLVIETACGFLLVYFHAADKIFDCFHTYHPFLSESSLLFNCESRSGLCQRGELHSFQSETLCGMVLNLSQHAENISIPLQLLPDSPDVIRPASFQNQQDL